MERLRPFARLLDNRASSPNAIADGASFTPSHRRSCFLRQRYSRNNSIRPVRTLGKGRDEAAIVVDDLPWGDIDLDKGIVDINKALIELNKSESKTGKASVEIKETKTTGSTRKITLDHDTVEFLRAEREAQRLTLAFYHVKQTDKTPVACDFRGNWYRPSCFTSAFIAFRDDHGFDGIRLHDLRHTQATLLLKNGEDILTVSRRLGHAKASTT